MKSDSKSGSDNGFFNLIFCFYNCGLVIQIKKLKMVLFPCIRLKLAIAAFCLSVVAHGQSFQKQYYIPELEPLRVPGFFWNLQPFGFLHHEREGTNTIISNFLGSDLDTTYPEMYRRGVTPFFLRLDPKGHVLFSKKVDKLDIRLDAAARNFIPLAGEKIAVFQLPTLNNNGQIDSFSKANILILDKKLNPKWNRLFGLLSGSLAKTLGIGGVVELGPKLSVLLNGREGPTNITTNYLIRICKVDTSSGNIDSTFALKPSGQINLAKGYEGSLRKLSETHYSLNLLCYLGNSIMPVSRTLILDKSFNVVKSIGVMPSGILPPSLNLLRMVGKKVFFSFRENIGLNRLGVGWFDLDSAACHTRTFNSPIYGEYAVVGTDGQFHISYNKIDSSIHQNNVTGICRLDPDLNLNAAITLDSSNSFGSIELALSSNQAPLFVHTIEDESINGTRSFLLTRYRVNDRCSFCFTQSIDLELSPLRTIWLDTIQSNFPDIKTTKAFDIFSLSIPTGTTEDFGNFCAKIPCRPGPSPVPVELTTQIDSCAGSALLTVSPDYLVPVWSNGFSGFTQSVNQNGKYNVKMKDYCATGSDSVILNLPPSFPDSISLSVTDSSCNQAIVEIKDGNSFKAAWFVNGNLQTSTENKQIVLPGSQIRVEINSGCGFRFAETTIPIPMQCRQFSLPNIVTVNSDGRNEKFEAGGDFRISVLEIFNRWGQKIFSADPYQSDWPDSQVQSGVYFFKLKMEGSTRIGWVEVVK